MPFEELILERKLHNCPEIDCNDLKRFPEASCSEIEEMELEFKADCYITHFFAFVKENDTGETFVNVYLWNIDLFPKHYKRFVILEGHRLSEEEERLYIKYARSQIWKNDIQMHFLNAKITSHFPNWHFLDYNGRQESMALEHLYYASHRSGIKEILYKAGLSNIAYRIYSIPSCNLVGTTPTSIIGHDLPLKLIRILNQPEFTQYLFEDKRIEQCKEIYYQYANILGDELPSIVQWKYLETLHKGGELISGIPFSRALYNKISSSNSMTILEDYCTFLMYRNRYSYLQRMKIPKAEDLYVTIADIEMTERIRRKNKSVDAMIRRRKECENYEYEGINYSVIMPSSASDFCLEGIAQRNCVAGYVNEHACGETTILFLRKNASLNKSFVTIEVKNREMTQVFTRFNALPSKDVYLFLMDYSWRRNLTCNPYKLITEGSELSPETIAPEAEEELMEFAELYNPDAERHHDQEEDKYVQMTIDDWLRSFPK